MMFDESNDFNTFPSLFFGDDAPSSQSHDYFLFFDDKVPNFRYEEKDFEEVFKVKQQNSSEESTESIVGSESSEKVDGHFFVVEKKRKTISEEVEKTEENMTENSNALLLQKKRGRKSKAESLKEEEGSNSVHTKYSLDNILKRIKVMFSNFCLQMINGYILKANNGMQRFKFRKVDSKISKNISVKFNKILLESPIKFYLLNDVSIKFREDKKDLNRIIYDKIYAASLRKESFYEELVKLMDLPYKTIFTEIFLPNTNKLEHLFSHELNSCIRKAKNFEECLEKMKQSENANEKYLDSIRTVANSVFVKYFIEGVKPRKCFESISN